MTAETSAPPPSAYEPGTVGALTTPALAVFSPDMSVSDTIERLRELVNKAFITYGFVVEPDGVLVGVLTMRDLLFCDRDAKLSDVMLKNPFYLTPEAEVMDAMKQVVTRHYPEYPVCDQNGRLIGTVRGHKLFEEQAFEISAQAGSMVGVEKEERLGTPWPRSFKFRHPWLQLNLLTAFVAGGVVSMFQDTINQVVILAVFLPVLAGQSGNTGCQALAVTLRGMTLGDMKPGGEKSLVAKEALLGLMNGTFVGITAGIGMFTLATMQSNPMALTLAMVVMAAMIGSCMVSGIFGAIIPMTLRRLGLDPATASSIFLTTATDVASMGLLLGLATWLLL